MTESAPSPALFAERLRAGRFVMTAEVAPPVSCDAQDLLRKAAPLRGLADAVNITDGAGARAHMARARRRGDPDRMPASSRSCKSPAATRTASRCKAN